MSIPLKTKSGNKKLTIILISLIPFVLYYILGDGGGTLRMGPDLFAIEETESIRRILITTTNKEIALEKKEYGWILNDEHGADERAVKQLLQTLTQIRIKAPVARSEHEKIIQHLHKEGKEIHLFAGRKNIQHYRVWQDPETDRTYMLHEGKKTPMEVHLPGSKKSVGSLFKPNSLYWRNNRLTEYDPLTITQITIEHEQDSFSIIRENETYYINGKLAKSLRVESYLQFIPEIRIRYKEDIDDAAWETQHQYAKIKLHQADTKAFIFTFYRIPKEPFSDKLGNTFRHDLDWLCLMRDGKKALVRYVDVDALIREKTYFY